jgi:hypothetical protein
MEEEDFFCIPPFWANKEKEKSIIRERIVIFLTTATSMKNRKE